MTLLTAQAVFAIAQTDPDVRRARGGGFTEDYGNNAYSSYNSGNDDRAGSGSGGYNTWICPPGMTGRDSSTRGSVSRLGNNFRDIAAASNDFSGNGQSTGDLNRLYEGFLRQGVLNRDPQGKCTLYVRKALQYSGMYCGAGLGLSPQSQAGPNLKASGFDNFIGNYSTPGSAPMGSILVYKSTPNVPGCANDINRAYGHIEAKTPYGYLSDYNEPNSRIRNPNATSGRCRQLIGVWVKQRPCGRGR